METIIDQMRELTDRLNAASLAYYQEDRELMTDLEYDALCDNLAALERESGIILENSPTQKIGFKILSDLQKVAHEKPLLSLDKTKNLSDLVEFLGNHEGLLSWKLDGLTVVLKYANGSLERAITRGTGQTGEDITHNARGFINIPRRISYKGALTIRGEAVISFSDFERINEELPPEQKYKNTRNLTSGSVRQLNSEICAGRFVRYFPFGVVSTDNELGDKKSEELAWLNDLGFECVHTVIVTADSIANAVQEFTDMISGNEYATDGLVVTYNDKVFSESLGATSKFPRDSIAFKWKDELKETCLLDIEWNTSRTGLINPVAVFNSVELEGTTVSRAGLHNVSVIEGLELGIGDIINVYKANMIIPQIAENITRSNTASIPDHCPACKEKSFVKNVQGTKFLYCGNISCRAVLLFALKHFTSRDALNIEGLSEKTLEKFIDHGFICKYPDIFTLPRFENEIIALDKFGQKSYDNLIKSIENAKRPKLYNFIYALGIPGVGLANAKLLTRRFRGSLNAIITACAEELNSIEGFGEIISAAVFEYFRNEKNLLLLNEILDFLTFENEEYHTGAKLKGLTFVVTGTLNSFRNRRELTNLIEENGGKTADSVSVNTSYLINNNAEATSGKNKKARELGVSVISEDEFSAMLKAL